MQTVSQPSTGQAIERFHAVPHLSDLSTEILQTVGDRARMHNIPAGHLIFGPEQSAETLFVLARGGVKVYRLSPEGRMVITRMIEPGDLFGELAFVEGALYGNYAEASVDCILYSIHRDYTSELFHDARIAQRITHMMGQRANELEYQLSVIALKSVSDRVVAFLRYLNRQIKDFVEAAPELQITHEELAHMVGANRESVTKVLNELQNQGVVALHRGSITLLHPDLVRTACEGNVI